jgi:hypothetical protein
MKGDRAEAFDTYLRQTAPALRYPPIPEVACAVRARLEGRREAPSRVRWAWAPLAIVLLAALLSLALPEARAALFEALRVGAVRILVGPPTETPTPTALPSPTSTTTFEPSPTIGPSASPSPSPTPAPSPTPLSSILSLAEHVSLAEAEAALGSDIPRPSYPADLGPADEIYLLDLELPVAVLLWEDSAIKDQVRMSLHVIRGGDDVLFTKAQPRVIERTEVNGRPAYWVAGPYYLEVQDLPGGRGTFRLLVEDRVLIWTEGPFTYRLESGLPLDEAVKIAESLE